MKKLGLIILILSLIGGVSALSYSTVLKDNDNSSIQDLINNAQPGGTINLENKNYTGEGNYSITVNKSITINGNGAIINAQQKGVIFNVSNINNSVSLNNMNLINGNNSSGGAINNKGNLTINNVNFTGNTADRYGGAIYTEKNSVLHVSNSQFKNNVANSTSSLKQGEYKEGGAIYSGNYSVLSVESSSFDGNFAEEGGAIYNDQKSVSHVSNSQFKNNVANSTSSPKSDDGYKEGGAIYSGNYSVLSVESSFFDSNFAEEGGAISNYADNGSVKSSVFTDNKAYKLDPSWGDDGSGGAIRNVKSLSVVDSNFTRNSAPVDGAISNAGSSSILIVSGSVFTENSAKSKIWSSGGAIDNTGYATITDSEFNNNYAAVTNDSSSSNSGAVCNNAKMTIVRSTFNNNSAVDGGAIKNQNFYGVSELNISDSTFNKNIGKNYGGAIYNVDAKLTIINTKFIGNTCNATNKTPDNGGGAVYNKNGDVTIKNSYFEDNFANGRDGGGICNYGSLNVQGTHFDNNKATGGGGGIWNY
ncbi:MAG: hypothetical protein LBC39_00280, partial [Methanobrevibacter sp.]|nr:hypothetical protein [Candidatus Methanovirga aequatorialis]